MSFTLRQIRYFVAAAELGSISRASQELSVSQSAVTEAIKDLEGRLGVRLFERRRRGLEITHHGHLFLRHAKAILSEVSSAERSIVTSPDALKGSLTIGVTSLTAGYVLSDILSRFRRAWPGVEVGATEDSSGHLEHLLIGGEVDVAVMVVSNLSEVQALNSEILAVSPYRLWLPMGHRLGRKESISLEDLVSEPQIVLDVDEMRAQTFRILSVFSERPRIAFRTRSVEAVRSLVASGAGVALLPDLVYRPWSLDGDRLESRDVSGRLPVVQVGLAWRRGAAMSAAARAFLEVAQSYHAPRSR